jgi:hypothetical protein
MGQKLEILLVEAPLVQALIPLSWTQFVGRSGGIVRLIVFDKLKGDHSSEF